MKPEFAEVLAREAARRSVVSDATSLAMWRRALVTELMTPHSSYLRALRQTGDEGGRSQFLDRWCALIAGTVERVVQNEAVGGGHGDPTSGCMTPAEAHRLAVLILASLHGGAILSRVADDPGPLEAALDLALLTVAQEGPGAEKPAGGGLIRSMDA